VALGKRRSVDASGKTVDDAIAKGLQMLQLQRSQVDIEILHPGSRGVLGIGAEDARIRLIEKPKAPPPPPPPPPEPTPAVSPPAEARAEAPPAAKPDAEAAEEEADLVQLGQGILQDVLTRMGLTATVETRIGHDLIEEETETPPVVFNIQGEDLGILIGRRGETLRALQYLVRLMVSHQIKRWSNLVVDVEDYRVRRRRALRSLAQRMAERVAYTGQTRALEPMPAHERRIVHMCLRDHPHVRTHSVGEGERRKVTIIPKQQ
jgi:spoIIIJ-associated protein